MPFYNGSSRAYGNIVIGFTQLPMADFAAYARGYYNAARLLADTLVNRPGYPDYDGYPIVYLYRQSLELFLKGIIYGAARILQLVSEEEGLRRIHNIHNLPKLYALAQEVLRRMPKFRDDPSLDAFLDQLQMVVHEFHEIDPSSYVFRYPIDPKGKRASQHHLVVSIGDIRDTFTFLVPHLEALTTYLAVERDDLGEAAWCLQEFFGEDGA